MFFFDDNTFILREGDPIGGRLLKIARERMLLMLCDQRANERSLTRPKPAGYRSKDVREGMLVRLLPRLLRRARRPPN